MVLKWALADRLYSIDLLVHNRRWFSLLEDQYLSIEICDCHFSFHRKYDFQKYLIICVLPCKSPVGVIIETYHDNRSAKRCIKINAWFLSIEEDFYQVLSSSVNNK